LPEILSAKEIVRILAATRTIQHRALLMTAYGAGLRVSELVALRINDLDAERGTIRVVHGKGMRDRYTLLSPRLLKVLSIYRKEYELSSWLFPSPDCHAPITVRTAQRVFADAKRRAGVVKFGGIHGLRHAFATHLLEAGTDIYMIQRLLGHRAIASTTRYIHVANSVLAATRSPLDVLPI
jgi:integrase/recombinase XerD